MTQSLFCQFWLYQYFSLYSQFANREENDHHPPAGKYLNAACVEAFGRTPAVRPLCYSGKTVAKFCNLLTSVASGQKSHFAVSRVTYSHWMWASALQSSVCCPTVISRHRYNKNGLIQELSVRHRWHDWMWVPHTGVSSGDVKWNSAANSHLFGAVSDYHKLPHTPIPSALLSIPH